MNYINRIKRFRDERCWTTNHMAVEAGIGSSTVVNWFGRNSTPKLEAIESLCNAFGISLSAFFNESEEVDYLTEEQREMLNQWNCLHKNEKSDLLKFITTLNENKKNNPL